VLPLPISERFDIRRLIGAGLLLAVFFLPLHFHFVTPTVQLTKECSCVYGMRTQAGPVAAATHWTPTFHVTFIVVYESQTFASILVHSRAIRAPPSFTSL
jgi:hypothetical protein